MALNQEMVSVGTTPVILNSNDTKSITVTNTHGSNIVYLGNSYVTSSAYGVKLTSGQSATINNLAGDLYAVASGSATVVSTLSSI